MKHRSGRALGSWALVLALVVVSGCESDGLERVPIDGTVTFDSKPLEDGRIQFFPESSNAIAIMGGAPIRAGSYAIPRAEGLVPGKYVVRISSASGEEVSLEENELMPGLGPIHPKELIPSKYNTETTLNAEVTADGPNTFDFPLEP